MYTRIAGPFAALAIAGAVVADDFLSYDVDKDGFLTNEETSLIQAFDFEAADRDRDGLVDATEFDYLVVRQQVPAVNLETDITVDPEESPASRLALDPEEPAALESTD